MAAGLATSEGLTALSHPGDACNETFFGNLTNITSDHAHTRTPAAHDYVLGVLLSIVADVVIAIALGIQKQAHNSNMGPDGKPVRPYKQLPLWWLGVVLNTFGELANLIAYGLAPASVVAPVGCIGVVVNEVIAVMILKEPLRRRDIGGLIGVMVGVVMIIVAVPETSEVLDVHELLSTHVIFAQRTYWYLIGMLLTIVVFVIVIEPRCAHEYILVWLLLCSGISSMNVVACRGWSSLLTQIGTDCTRSACVHGVLHGPCEQTLFHWLFWVLLALVIITAIWSATYLNRAMQVYGNTEVVPVYYCTFTLASVVGGAVVYNEFERITAGSAAVFVVGMLLAFAGVALLMSGRHGHRAAEFLQLAPDAKVEALERQPSASRLFGGLGASVVQASVDAEISADRSKAIVSCEEANYPSSLRQASRIHSAGRPLPQPTWASPVRPAPVMQGDVDSPAAAKRPVAVPSTKTAPAPVTTTYVSSY